VRVVWEGCEYRGRGRETRWDGRCTLEGNTFTHARGINFWNPLQPLEQPSPDALTWTSLTTGGFAGFDAWLADADAGTLRIETPLVQCKLPVADIANDDGVFEAGGLGRRLRVFRLPDRLEQTALRITLPVSTGAPGGDAIYVRVTTEDGHRAWTSPAYLVG
jgi:hypothetical protein